MQPVEQSLRCKLAKEWKRDEDGASNAEHIDNNEQNEGRVSHGEP
jgi:hypothetical protein